MAEWGGYSLLDEAMKLKMAGQAQAYTPGTPSLTGSPATGTAIPAISPELMAGPTVKPEATFSEKLMKGMQDLSPLMAQVGTSLMRGRNTLTGAPTETVGSQVGGALASTLSTMKMNEALKKMIAAQLSGGGGVGGGAGFTGGQPLGLSSAETVGLTPEQISGIYGTGLQLREKELARPMTALATISDAYLKVMSGEAKPAEMEAHLATAQKAYQEIAAAPTKTMVELLAKIQGMEKAQAEIGEIQARTKTEKEKPETARVERKKTERQISEIEAKLDPRQIRLLEVAKTAGGQVKLSDAGDRLVITDPATGTEMGSIKIGAKPETAAKTKAEELPLKKFAMQRIAPLVVTRLESELAAMPGGKQKVDLQNLISSLRGYTGEIDPGVLLAKSSPELQDKFNKLMDIYIRTPGLSETEFGNIVQGMIGKGAAPVPTEKPTGKGVVEKFRSRPGAAAPTPKPTPASLAPEVYASMLRESKKGKGTWGIGAFEVDYDGKNVVAIRPRRETPGTTPSINPYGTF